MSRFVYAVMAVLTTYVCIRTFAPRPVGLTKLRGGDRGTIGCVRRTICAETPEAMVLLFFARLSAYVMYVALILVFLTKCHASRTALARTCLSIWIPFHDLHTLHATMGGSVIGWGTVVHTLVHVARWATQGNLDYLYSQVSGRSGVVAVLCMGLVILPMAWERLRSTLSYEVRKYTHVLFALSAMIALMYHAPKTNIGPILALTLAVYGLDVLYQTLVLTYKVESTVFHRLEKGVQLSFRNPPGFAADSVTGYVYVLLPWISQHEWHAFSLYSQSDDCSSICVSASGDWTRKLHAAVAFDTVRPCFVAGPYTSPYATATDFDNLVLVASGIGITPALQIIEHHKATRRVNLIWMTRDASMIEFFLSSVEFDDDAYTTIYYTGKRKLCIDALDLPPTVLVFEKRPNLETAIRGVIHAIETGAGLPEAVVSAAKTVKRRAALEARSLRAGQDTDDPVVKATAAMRRALHSDDVDGVMALFRGVSGGIRHWEQGASASAAGGGLDAAGLAQVCRTQGFDLTSDEAAAVVAAYDVDGDGHISLDELRRKLEAEASSRRELEETTTPAGRRSSKETIERAHELFDASATEHDISKNAFFRDVPRGRLADWEILYCGGAQRVVETLSAFAADHHITFRKEKFDW